MADVISALLLWIGAHTGYTVGRFHPNVVMVEPYRLCRLYGEADQVLCRDLRLKGIYNKAYTIYLRTDFEPESLEDRARLLHELVHWVQWSNGHNEKTQCMGQLEVEAYELQDEWRAQFGLRPKSDAFTLLMLEASCNS